MKRPVMTSVCFAVFFGLSSFGGPMVASGAEQTIHGFLFAKLGQIGTRSEGPEYFLQKWDYSEIPIAKNALLFQSDPKLQPLVGHKVKLTGEMIGDAFHYATAASCDGTMECELPGR